ncbi:MAG: winged helix-turn-helix domain-containing protein [Clostridia bacterium]|nr:winged helix-turn-helix domain-containing protein [Clostridia bacterium]
MAREVEIRLLGGCVVRNGEETIENLPQRSRKGVALMIYLILHRGQPVSGSRLIREIWGRSSNTNPENALKTMVSRLRTMLGELSPTLSACIASGQGAYRWENQNGVFVDVLEVLTLNDRLRQEMTENERMTCCQQLLSLYDGDLYAPEDMLNSISAVSQLHRIYLDTALSLIELKRKRESWSDILSITDAALKIDDMDEPLQIERLRALVQLHRTNEAMKEYRQLSERERRLLDAEPGEDLQQFYREMSQAGSTLRYNLDALRAKLTGGKNEKTGPFFCDMDTFREIYHISIRNLERLGSTMFLGLIMLGDGDEKKQDPIVYKGAFATLEEILRRNLRGGDIVTQCDDYVLALMLPTVNYRSGAMVLERIEHIFYTAYPREKVPFHARITPLGGEN